MTLDQIEQKVAPALPRFRGLKAVVRFELDGAGVLVLDATQTSPLLSRTDREAACTIHTTPENLLKLMDGTLDPTVAYMTGKIKIKGSMGVAMKLSAMLGDLPCPTRPFTSLSGAACRA
ncbi:MAG: SCP2 sterol-binding domain-containing protein [Pseudomonadota bacterium]|nr:SCP2 sterol-binding domain-containing protein [Pseudomonadota bacterium]